MQENLKALFEGVQGLSEDFHIKLETLVEAKVADRVESEIAQIKEQADEALAEEKASLKEASAQYAAYVKDELAEQVSVIVAEVSAKWLEENKQALVDGSKVEMAESVLTMLQGLFESNGLNIAPDAKAVLDAKSKELEEAQTHIVELETKLQEAADAEFSAKKASLFESELDGLADTQKEKAIRIVESFGDDNLEEIKTRLQAVRSLVEGKEDKPAKVEESTVVDASKNTALNESVDDSKQVVIDDPVMSLIYEKLTKKSSTK